MNNPSTTKLLGFSLLLLVVLPVLSGCGENHETVDHSIREMQTSGDSQPVNADIEQRWDNTDTRAITEFKRKTFYVLNRTNTIEKYPCQNCHTESFNVQDDADVPDQAHWELEIDHGSIGAADDFECASCHDPDNPDQLLTPAGKSVSIDDSHRFCASCHQQEVKDWAGGAHGKRHDYWQGERVIYTCAECHDPHDPGLEKRWPVTHPSIPRKSKGADQ